MKRRAFLALISSLAVLREGFAIQPGKIIRRTIPGTGETLPVIGMGSWLTFDVEDDPVERDIRVKVLKAFFDGGGALIDSSPMYGSSQEVIGYCISKLKARAKSFSATKVWTYSRPSGLRQIRQAEKLWGLARFDLMQIHNMLQWPEHLQTLRRLKAQRRIRYIGITTSHGRRHHELMTLLERETFDFVQFTYNIIDREAEQTLLPLAKERGIAVIINRPFQGGSLFSHVVNKRLPVWAKEFDCQNWAQFFLKYIVSHPAVTCAIPATSRVDHMVENMGACYGVLPDPQMRIKMHRYIRDL